jgi:hypothetical protein
MLINQTRAPHIKLMKSPQTITNIIQEFIAAEAQRQCVQFASLICDFCSWLDLYIGGKNLKLKRETEI